MSDLGHAIQDALQQVADQERRREPLPESAMPGDTIVRGELERMAASGQLREDLRARIGLEPHAALEEEPDPRAELERRRRRLAPEVLAGDEASIAELDQLDAAIAAETRRRELAGLAEAEQTERARASAAEAAETQRAEQLAEADREEVASTAELATLERTLTAMLAAARAAIEHAQTAASLRQQTGSARSLILSIENRIVRQIRTELGPWGVRPGELIGSQGLAPLASTGSCVVCMSDRLADIEASRDARDPLRAIQERFGISKTALSDHFRGHP